MNANIQKIELVKPIKPEVRKSKSPAYYYEVFLKLTKPPTAEWISLFEEHYKFEAKIFDRRDIKIAKNWIMVPLLKMPSKIPSPIPPEIKSEITGQIDFIKRAIDKANAEHEKVQQQKITEIEDEKRLPKKEELGKLQHELDKMDFD